MACKAESWRPPVDGERWPRRLERCDPEDRSLVVERLLLRQERRGEGSGEDISEVSPRCKCQREPMSSLKY